MSWNLLLVFEPLCAGTCFSSQKQLINTHKFWLEPACSSLFDLLPELNQRVHFSILSQSGLSMFHVVLSLPAACQDLIRRSNTFQSLRDYRNFVKIKLKSITNGHFHRTILPCFTFTVTCFFVTFPLWNQLVNNQTFVFSYYRRFTARAI